MMSHSAVIAPLNGMLLVHSDAGDWIVPPTGVLRLKAGVGYALHKAPSVQAHVVMLPGANGQEPSDSNQLYRASGLVRELMATLGSGSLRSEEHTSELQSRFDLVCRLLLEKI